MWLPKCLQVIIQSSITILLVMHLLYRELLLVMHLLYRELRSTQSGQSWQFPNVIYYNIIKMAWSSIRSSFPVIEIYLLRLNLGVLWCPHPLITLSKLSCLTLTSWFWHLSSFNKNNTYAGCALLTRCKETWKTYLVISMQVC